ncbi:MAG: polyprenyl synthetase family protein [Acidobacteriota bacterium]|nr:polyprenyl synthetase family protein [Acidobacteriota bacterium]
MSAAAIDTYVAELRALVDEALAKALPADAPPLVADAMRYSLLAGGKRLRPVLALAAADAIADRRAEPAAGARMRALPAAVALELIHTYSLIHDDLPAMDDDTLRRGRPTSHVVFGDGLAILAGDGLLTEAFAILSERESRLVPARGPHATEARKLEALAAVARGAGAWGMVGGQAIDLHAAGKTPVALAPARTLDAAGLRDMHMRKTGALMQAAVLAGGVLAGADRQEALALQAYGFEVGLAFQIVDDLLDVEGSNAALGKTAGKDAAAGKPTYPSLFGLEESRRLAAACVERALAALADASLGGRLPDLARVMLGRTS